MGADARPPVRRFEVPALFTPPAFDGADGRPAVKGVALATTGTATIIRTTYLDTPDLRLVRAGVALHHTSGGPPDERPTWHLRVPTLAGSTEVTEPGGLSAMPVAVAALLPAWLRGASAAPVAVLRAEVAPVLLSEAAGGHLAEVRDETLSVLEGRRVLARSREVTLVVGDDLAATDPLVEALAERLRAAGAVPAPVLAPAVRALGPRASAPPDLPPPGRLRPSAPAGDVVAAALRTAVARLLLADTSTRLDAPDGVHQLRVACRRMRSDLATFAPLVEPAWSGPLRDRLRVLADTLSAARDLEVLRERLATSALSDPLAPLDPAALARLDAALSARADAAETAVAVALAEPDHLALLAELVAAAQGPLLLPLADRPARDVLPALVADAWGQLDRRVRRLRRRDPDERWHRARIRAKRARYAAEAVAPAMGRRALTTAKAAASVQEVLGEHQDAAIAADALLSLAASVPHDAGLVLLCGRLVERQRALVRDTRRRLPSVWAAVDHRAVTGWLG